MGSLFVTSYSLALGDPVPHRIDAALVGDPTSHPCTVDAVEGVARGSLVFHRYPSVPAAVHAIDEQDVYVALDLTSRRPTLYVASAAGASVARVLERISTVDPTVGVVDTHPLGTADPNGLESFYLMLATTIVGFITVFQVRANAAGLRLRQWTVFVALAVAGSLVFTLVEGPLLGRLELPVLESWGILALQLAAVASFASLMAVLIGPWAILPTWLFFVVLGNSSSGGAVAPPLLPLPFALGEHGRGDVGDRQAADGRVLQPQRRGQQPDHHIAPSAATATSRSSANSAVVSQRRRSGAGTWAPAGPARPVASRPPAVAPTRNTTSDTVGASTGKPCAPAAPKASRTTLPVMLAVNTRPSPR